MNSTLHPKSGYSLVELLIYLGITTVVMGIFAAILVIVTRIQSQQTGSNQVASELNFVMGTVKRLIRNSTSLTVASSTLTIGTNSSSTDPTIITLSGGQVTEQDDGSAATALTTDKIIANQLSFVNFTNASSQVVQVVLKFSFNTTNPQQADTQTLESSAIPLRLLQ